MSKYEANERWHAELVAGCLEEHARRADVRASMTAVIGRAAKKLATNHPDDKDILAEVLSGVSDRYRIDLEKARLAKRKRGAT